MFSKITAIFMCLITAFTSHVTMLFSGLDLKIQLSKGFYESPYIVRPLEDITVEGVSIDYFAVYASEDSLSTLAAMSLNDEIHDATGKGISVSSTDSDKAFIINEKLNEGAVFNLSVKDGKVYITGGKEIGISRGIRAFFDEVVLSAEGVYNLENGFEYTKVFSDFVTYEQFGAKGDGKTDDMSAIVSAHEYANEYGLSVFAGETSTYYIGGKAKTAVIKTDTDWSTASFVIDDKNVENRSSWIFNIAPERSSYSLGDVISPLKIDAETIGVSLDSESLVVLYDSNVKRYIRKGANQNSGSSQTDVILVDENGNISADTPLIWDFDAVTAATVYPIDKEVLTVSGGRFTTLANAAPSEYTYYTRGIQVRRSNTVIDGIYHDVKDEGKTGAPYSAFVSISCCADVTVKDSTFTGHKRYETVGSAGTSVAMGTYDIGANTAVNAKFINCNQTNDITDGNYWGIAGTNYCKNLTYDGCAFSRFDAHQGVRNANIKNSVLGHHGIKLIGMGTALIENTTVMSKNFIDLRDDYGSTWNGEIIIRNCKFYPSEVIGYVISATNSEDHDFGYTCYLPERVEIDGFFTYSLGMNFIFPMVNSKHLTDSYEAQYPVVPPEEIIVKDFSDLAFGDVFVSPNVSIFKVKIEK